MELLERDPYLTELHNLLASAADGSGRLLLMGGEAGVGKTSLVTVFSGQVADSVTVIRSACDALSTPGPLNPVRAYAVALGVPFASNAREHERRDELFHGILDAIERQDRPVLMLLEDAHWSDEATLDLVRVVGRRVADLPLLWIVTYRDDELGFQHPLQRVLGDLATAPGARRMTLKPLTEDSVRILADHGNLDPATLYRRTGGNPFYVTEALATGDDAVPASVADAVLARAARLSPSARDVLRVAAVIGARADTDLLLGVAGDVLDEIEECVERGLLSIEASQLVFRHQIARDAVYAQIIPPRRRLLHGRTLAVLSAMPDRSRHLAQLAHHAELADDREQTFAFAITAGQQAAKLGAHREAAAQYARALRVAGPLTHDERATLFECWAYECYLTNQLADAIAGRRHALEIWTEAGDRLRRGENLRWLSRLYWFTGRNQEAAEAAEAALEVLEPLSPGPQLAWAYSNMAQLRMYAHDTDGAMRWGERAIALAEELGQQAILAHALNTVGAARLIANDERGRADLERSFAIVRTAGPGNAMEEHASQAWINLSSIGVRRFRLGQAERDLADGIDFATQHDLESCRFYMTAWRGTLHLHQGRWDEAERDCTTVLRRPTTPTTSRIVALTVLGRLRALRGDPDAWAPLDEGLALATPTGETQRLGPVHLARAEAAWLAGDLNCMASEAEAARCAAAGTDDRWLRSEAAYWLWRAGGDPPPGTALTEPFALEIAGDHAAAARAWEALGCPFYAARALLQCDQEGHVREALAVFDRLGAEPAARMALQRLRELGARSPRTTTRAHPAGLTSREAEILELMVGGSTNRQIADHLYLSPKTVEHHVSAILGKLGVRTRVEAAQLAGRLHSA